MKLERRNFFVIVLGGIVGLYTKYMGQAKANSGPSIAYATKRRRIEYPLSNGEPFRFDLGDIYGEDRGDLGINFRRCWADGKGKYQGDQVMFLNQASELSMLEYLKLKYPQGNKSPNVLLGNRRESKLWTISFDGPRMIQHHGHDRRGNPLPADAG